MLIENPKMTPQNLNIINVSRWAPECLHSGYFLSKCSTWAPECLRSGCLHQKLAVDLNPIFAFQACNEIFEVKAKKVR